MWAVVGSALAARRGQALVITLVTLLAATAVAAAPWYAVSATQQVGVAALAATPVPDRLIEVSRQVAPDRPHPPDPYAELRRQFAPAGFSAVAGGDAAVELASGGADAGVRLAYREGVCDHLALTGACPAAAGEVLLPARLARELEVGAGDEVATFQTGDPVRAVRVVGVYQVADPAEPYWGTGELAGGVSALGGERPAVFTVAASLPDYQRVTYTYELVAIPEEFATIDLAALESTLAPGLAELRRQDYSVTTTDLDRVAARAAQDRRNVAAGVGTGVAVLLLFTWFALVVVLREAVVQLRGDVGWWRLHGAPAGRGWACVLGQSVAPLLAGAVAGGAAGTALGHRLLGTVAGAGPTRTALQLSLLLAGVALAGGLVAVVATQLGSLRTPVRDLLRRVPARSQGWRRSLLDLTLVALATAAVGQALSVGPDAGGLALLAPGLAVLAIALVAAWAVPPLAARLAARAMRAGALAVTLVAASVARRPGAHRLFALVAVAVGLLATALSGWHTDARDQSRRAALEVGADRVVTVAPVDAARLLAAVRAADPTGTRAMAVVHRNSTGGHPAVLAVDSTRLPAIAKWRAEYGGAVDQVAAALRPAAPEPVVLTADRLELAAAGADPAGDPVHLRLRLRATGSGELVEAVVGPLAGRPETYAADLPGCSGGCRLVGVELLGEEAPGAPAGWQPVGIGTRVELRAAGGGPAALPAPERWRPALAPQDLGPAITAGADGGLRLTVPQPPANVRTNRDGWVFVADTPAPVPVVATGWRRDPTAESRAAPLAGAAVPVELAGTASLLPRLGAAGILVDLEYAERMVPLPVAGGTSQVWLSGSAPPSVLDDLRAAGLRPLRTESLSQRAGQLAAEGSAVGVRFQAAVAAVALLLTAGAVLVLTARETGGGGSQGAGRAAELAALRAQGVGRVVVRTAGYAGPAAVTAGAVAVGLAAGVAGAAIARVLHPGFIDGWEVLPRAPLHPFPAGLAAAAAALVLGGAVAAAAAGPARRTRGWLP